MADHDNTIEFSDANDALIDSLLKAAYQDEDSAIELRIGTVLAQIQSSEPTTAYQAKKTYMLKRLVPLSLAASILLIVTFGFLQGIGLNQAQAAIARCISVMPATRKYDVTILSRRPNAEIRESHVTLYLNDKQQFAIHHPGLTRLGKVWIGGGPESRWVVPPVGPILIGGEDLVGRWMSSQAIETPMLHVESMLQRMKDLYRLEIEEQEWIDSSVAPETQVECQYIIGRLAKSRDRLPSKIEVWANVQTGMAEKIILTWEKSDSMAGPIQWTLVYSGSPELDSDWFDYRGHASPRRNVRRIEKIDDLHQLVNQSEQAVH